jgi:dTDP-L-rhamnose 4-epimerase
MTRVLITGGAGFIGSHTADMLIENGYKVTILDSLVESVHRGKKPDYLNKKARFMLGDVSKKKPWEKCLKDTDIVMHLASLTGISQSMYTPDKYCTANINGTAMLYETLLMNKKAKSRIKKIIIASSKTIYGEGAYRCTSHGIKFPELRGLNQLKKKDWEFHCPECEKAMECAPIPESKPANLLSMYAMTKYSAERMAIMYEPALQIPTVAFRYFSVFGERQSLSNPYTGVCSIFLSRILNGNQPVIFEDGQQVRDFIHVQDVARANLLAVKKEEFSGVYNIGSGKGQSIKNVALMISKILGKKTEPKITEGFRYGDTRNDLSDNSKIEKCLGFKTKISFENGISRLIEWSSRTEAKDLFDRAEKERLRILG